MMSEFASSPCLLGQFGLDGPAPRIALAVHADAAEIAAVLVASIDALCAADHKGDPQAIAAWTANKTPDQVRAWIDDAALDVLVSREEEGCAIACVGACNAEWILLNYVAPDFRGRGHSAAMLAALEARIAARGTRTARLMSTETAHAFYSAHGWRDEGRDDCSGAGALRGHRMAKDLAP